MYTRILLPLDGSDLAERALPHAQGLARSFGATLHLLHVISRGEELAARPISPSDEYREMTRETIEAQNARSREYLEGLAKPLRESGVSVETDIRHGSVDQKIVEYARESEIDLITMSTHGHGGIRHLMLGSITDRVLHSSHVPVLVLPH